MKKFFYLRLAFSNIKKNHQVYFPYMGASLFTVMMYYTMHALSINSGLLKESYSAPAILELGTYVILIFSVIFLFYVNSFLIKRRKKEIALYNILGMEKKHMILMMFYETLITASLSILGGILLGILFSKLMFLILLNLAGFSTSLYYEIPVYSVGITMIIYFVIFMCAYLFNVIQIHISRPIELLKSGSIGEKEPRSNWLIALLGLITLSAGYVLALTIKDPLSVMALFFVAVLLVIRGTYFLFTAGSIIILKLLKKNNHFYYQTHHFISVSQMIYRMKQNAVGLATICILCTCILVMISSTLTLYLGVDDSSQLYVESDYVVKIYDTEGQLPTHSQLNKIVHQINDIGVDGIVVKNNYQIPAYWNGKQLFTGENSQDDTFTYISLMTLDEYNYSYHQNKELKDDEILFASNFISQDHSMTINNQTYAIQLVDDSHFLTHQKNDISNDVSIVMKDEQTLTQLLKEAQMEYRNPIVQIYVDYSKNSDAKEVTDALNKIFNNYSITIDGTDYTSVYDSVVGTKEMYMSQYGFLFFLGLYLGVLFLMAIILIMYYKQLSEGYEDQKRYEIMQNVGMNQKEVKQAIQSQVLIFFFLPIVVAVIHMSFAFNMIYSMFESLIASGSEIMLMTTGISVLILFIIYAMTYMLTAKTYYKIVKH